MRVREINIFIIFVKYITSDGLVANALVRSVLGISSLLISVNFAQDLINQEGDLFKWGLDGNVHGDGGQDGSSELVLVHLVGGIGRVVLKIIFFFSFKLLFNYYHRTCHSIIVYVFIYVSRVIENGIKDVMIVIIKDISKVIIYQSIWL